MNETKDAERTWGGCEVLARCNGLGVTVVMERKVRRRSGDRLVGTEGREEDGVKKIWL